MEEVPPAEIVGFVAAQLGLPVSAWSEYAKRDQTRREHLQELQRHSGLRLLSVADYRCLAGWVTTLAMQTSKGIVLVQEVIEEMRRRRLLLPLITVIERMCAKAATRAFIAGTKTNALLRVVLGRSASHPKQISGLSVLKFPFSEVTRVRDRTAGRC